MSGNVCHDRHLPAERLINLGLAGTIVEVVVTTDDVGNAHVMVVHNDCQHVCGRAVRTQQDEVVEVLILPNDASLDLILDDGFPRERRLEPDHRTDARRRVLWIKVAAAAVIKARAAFRPGLFAHRGQLIRAAIAPVSMPGGEQLLGHLTMAGRA
jgi:hypothetical protein